MNGIKLTKKTTLLLSASLLMTSSSTFAAFKLFEAPMSDAKWEFNGNPLACQLNHDIPLYGKASFSKIAGRKTSLDFKLSYKRHPLKKAAKAQVRAVSPSWQPNKISREMGELSLLSGDAIIKSKDLATWKLLNTLEIGSQPTFYYQDFDALEDQVAVSLSTIGFNSEYDKFLSCLSGLVTYPLNELTKMTLYFDFDRSQIKPNYTQKLKALAQYIKYDPSIEVVLLNGHTDSKGSRSYNEKLSQQRAESVKKILQLSGVEDSRFKIQAFGEKSPTATNRTKKGRALNRRVYIQIAQS